MTSSGTATFNPTLSGIITKAFRKMRVIRDDEVPDPDMRATALISLNEMVHDWQTTGIHVWTEQEGVLFPQPGQTRYTIGSGSTDNFTDAFDYAASTTTVAAVAAAHSVTCDDVSDMAINDNIGIELDDGSVQWTTISNIAGSVVTFVAALTDAVALGNRVFAYTTRIIRPLKVTRGARLNLDGQQETPFSRMWSRQEYMDQPNKASRGSVNAMFYAPMIPLGEVYLWQCPNDVDNLIRFTWHRPIFDFSSNLDTADFPQEWSGAMTWGLAAELSSEYPVPSKVLQVIMANAPAKLQRLMSWDREPESVFIQPDYDE